MFGQMLENPIFRRWSAITGLAGGLFGFGNLCSPTVVDGVSMEPTLQKGQMVWVDRFHYRTARPQRGEVIVFRHQGEIYMKRIYRAPGERLSYIASNGSFVRLVRDSQADTVRKDLVNGLSAINVVQMQVPQDSVWVLGDNFDQSLDSREFGAIPISSIIGRVRVDVNPLYHAERQAVYRPRVHRTHG